MASFRTHLCGRVPCAAAARGRVKTVQGGGGPQGALGCAGGPGPPVFSAAVLGAARVTAGVLWPWAFTGLAVEHANRRSNSEHAAKRGPDRRPVRPLAFGRVPAARFVAAWDTLAPSSHDTRLAQRFLQGQGCWPPPPLAQQSCEWRPCARPWQQPCPLANLPIMCMCMQCRTTHDGTACRLTGPRVEMTCRVGCAPSCWFLQPASVAVPSLTPPNSTGKRKGKNGGVGGAQPPPILEKTPAQPITAYLLGTTEPSLLQFCGTR